MLEKHSYHPATSSMLNYRKRQLLRYFLFGFLATCLIHRTFFTNHPRDHHQRHAPTKIQHSFSRTSQLLAQTERLDIIRKEFVHAWTSYKDHGWMADALSPLSGTRQSKFCGWSATLVDGLDTLYIMGLTEEFEDALNAVLSIDFTYNANFCEMNLFESTIRYLGGLLGAYDLSQDARLLPKITQLGDMLITAFDTPTGVPCTKCHLTSISKEDTADSVPLADVGSLYLEFARLSQITNDPKYLSKVLFLTDLFASSQNESSIPGLWPERLDKASVVGEDRSFVRESFAYSLGALSDSAYEYLVKAHLFMGKQSGRYAEMWDFAAPAIRNYMLFRAYLPDATNDTDLLFSGIATRYPESGDIFIEARTQHLACFAGGLFAMASRIFDEPNDMLIGEQLTKGCVWSYDNSPSGIMPETFTLLPCPELYFITDLPLSPAVSKLDAADHQNNAGNESPYEIPPQCAWNESEWTIQKNVSHNCAWGMCEISTDYPRGFLSSIDPKYLLRPEAIESVFIMYRMTGDPQWRETGWRMFQSIITHTRTPFGHAALENVMHVQNSTRFDSHGRLVSGPYAPQRDDMESFWFAETLKYFYLLFSEPGLVSLDDWVLNTEAHPLRLTKGIRGFG